MYRFLFSNIAAGLPHVRKVELILKCIYGIPLFLLNYESSFRSKFVDKKEPNLISFVSLINLNTHLHGRVYKTTETFLAFRISLDNLNGIRNAFNTELCFFTSDGWGKSLLGLQGAQGASAGVLSQRIWGVHTARGGHIIVCLSRQVEWGLRWTGGRQMGTRYTQCEARTLDVSWSRDSFAAWRYTILLDLCHSQWFGLSWGWWRICGQRIL